MPSLGRSFRVRVAETIPLYPPFRLLLCGRLQSVGRPFEFTRPASEVGDESERGVHRDAVVA